jgi:hypothetical protein
VDCDITVKMLNDKRLSFVNRPALSLGMAVSWVEFLDCAQLLTVVLCVTLYYI